MPLTPVVPTWTAWNNANFTSPTALSDPISGQYYASGCLNVGDYFDATGDEAMTASYLTNGVLYSGRYRFVQVDSGATAANVKTGTVGYVRSGSTMKTVITTNVGSGGTAGTYTINATTGSGGGAGAQISITVGSAGTITAASVLNPGYGYVSPPLFNVNTTATGLTGGAVVGQLGCGMNIVTSADVAIGTASLTNAGIGPIHPVVFLNSITPGNYGFVQELGVATVLAGSTNQQTQGYNAVPVNGGGANGTMATSVNTYSLYTIGTVIDPTGATVPANTPFKILLNGPVVQD
jgi:hypothetical protein